MTASCVMQSWQFFSTIAQNAFASPSLFGDELHLLIASNGKNLQLTLVLTHPLNVNIFKYPKCFLALHGEGRAS